MESSRRRLVAVVSAALLAACLALLWALGTRESSAELPVEIFSLALPSASGGAAGRVIRAYSDVAGAVRLPDIPDGALVSRNRTLFIGQVHDNGYLHRGVWLFVRNRRGHVLLLRRSERTVTCPLAWSLVGEHSNVGETWEQTARRSLTEELAVPTSLRGLRLELLGRPVLFRTDYAADGGRMEGSGRKLDLQATALLAVTLPDGLIPALRFDKDVADTRWTSLKSLERLANAAPAGPLPTGAAPNGGARADGNRTSLCNPLIRALLALGIARLEQHDAAARARPPLVPAAVQTQQALSPRRTKAAAATLPR